MNEEIQKLIDKADDLMMTSTAAECAAMVKTFALLSDAADHYAHMHSSKNAANWKITAAREKISKGE